MDVLRAMALSILLHPPTALWRREALAASRGTFWVRMDGASSLRIYRGQGAEAAGLASAGMAPRTPPGALPGAPEPAVVRCVVMKGGRSRTTRSGRIPALSFLSALLPSSIYLTRGIVALVESRLQSARGSGEGRICHAHRAARLRGDRHNWRPG